MKFASVFVVLFFVLAAPVYAQSQCQDAEVSSFGPKRAELLNAWRAEIAKSKRRPDGGYDLSPAVGLLQEQLAAHEALVQRCAEFGNAHARYLHGLHFEWLADWFVASLKDKDALQPAPMEAVRAQVAASENYSEANKWFTLAANQGHPGAMKLIGDNYAEGKGFAQSKYLGVEWYSKAANRAIEIGNREFAILCLERMTALDSNHPVTKSLLKTLYGGTRD